jgi:MYXO-CTERM domain-containing protein
VLVAATFVGPFVRTHQARACSAALPSAPTAIPRTGATDVPTSTSLIILSSGQPSQVTLTAGGIAVPIDGVASFGGGIDGTTGQFTAFWRVRTVDAMLPPSAELVLSVAGPNNTRSTVTTLTTAAGYDKAQGTPANLKSLTLVRVRYKLSDIAAGQCVFAEYHGYVMLDAEPAVIPGTPPASVVSTLTIAPRHGGAAPQSFTFTGPNAFAGGGPLPDNYPSSQPTWKPDFDPTLEYCAAISSFGYGDLSRLAVVGNTVCTHVTEVAVPGAGDVVDGGPDASSGTSSEGGTIPDSGAAADGATTADSGAAVDAGASNGSAHDTATAGAGGDAKTCAPPGPSGGCSVAGAPTVPGPMGPTALVLLAAATIGLRQRRSVRSLMLPRTTAGSHS